jgi:immunity protein 26 of polymorphic toxin system/PH (Pleckstrin Homology) domain-containing protein
MTSGQRAEATRIGVWAFRRELAGTTISLWYWFGYFLVALAVGNLHEKHPPLLAVAADVVIFAVLVWTLYRPWHMGVRFGDQGVTVRNYFRTHRARWAEVTAFTDGTTDGQKWALAVMLRNGRGITATATEARPGSPRVLTAVRQGAARRGVPATVTGVAAERPRAWLAAASEARRQRAWLAAWATVTLIAGAGVVLLIRWGSAHSRSYSPAGLAGLVAVAGLIGALAARGRRKRARRQAPAQDRDGEGGWFAVPLPKGAGFAPGLIARTEPRQNSIALCYFFSSTGTSEPTLDQVSGLRAGDAVLVQKLGELDKKWPRLGQAQEWDRAAWPVPAFRPPAKKAGPPVKVTYDDDLGFISEEISDGTELDGLPSNELLSAASAPVVLAGLLKESPEDGVSRGRRRRNGQRRGRRRAEPDGWDTRRAGSW